MKHLISLILILHIAFCQPSITEAMERNDSVTIFMIGDSTMADKDTGSDRQERGWGQLMPRHIKGNVRIENHAVDGQSSKSFIDEGRWDKVLSLIKEGDYVIIQFGHNDEKEDLRLHTVPGKSFDDNLRRFVRETRKHGGIPILMNQIVRRNFPPTLYSPHRYIYDKEGDILVDTHGEYSEAPRRVAREEKALFVDMTALSHELISSLGNEQSKNLYMWIPKDRFEFCPNGKIDNTHLSPEGADQMAATAIKGIMEQLPEFALYVKNDVIWKKGEIIRFYFKSGSHKVLSTAFEILSHDIANVLDSKTERVDNQDNANVIIVIDSVACKSPQGFNLKVTDDQKIMVTGHDCHGAAYAFMELSRLIGVSPWEWWADAIPETRDKITFAGYYSVERSPSVEYRGIFINDEDWGLLPWSYKNHDPGEKGTIGAKTTSRIFELLLRLRANTYWPPMHECSTPFFLTPGNRETAEKYGIYIGGSHCEPMASSTAGEWPLRGIGEYDYVSNRENVKSFWETRLKDINGQEIIYTLGMRGVHDGAMKGAKGVKNQMKILTEVITDQRKMLSEHNLSNAPQVFIPYKEVLDVYNAGLEIPDDVTLMWCDDNYGYIRHFPDSTEVNRRGGNGIYYHVSYWGQPHDYLWLGTFSPGLLFQQINEAYNRGIKRMWILNAGDIKPAEYLIELFLDMAWDIDNVRHMGVERHQHAFLAREFSEPVADKLLNVMKEHYRLAHQRKPEFMGGTRTEEWGTRYFDTIRDLPLTENEITARLAKYHSLSDSVERYSDMIPLSRIDTYYQLIKYPVQAADQMNRKILYGQLARHGKSEWSRSHLAYDSIQSLTRIYNDGICNNGKWHGIMDCQPRSQAVFKRLDERSATSPMKQDRKILMKWNGTDGHGHSKACEWLGYENGAVELYPGKSITFECDSIMPDTATLEVCLLPSHSASDVTQSFMLTVDNTDLGIIDFSTQGRSEEWKQNVLCNQAKRKLRVTFKPDAHHHIIEISPISEPVIVDQIYIIE